MSPAVHERLLAEGYVAIALDRTPVGHFALRGAVNGHGVTMLVDTGASRTVIGRTVARTLTLAVHLVDNLGGGLGVTGAATYAAPVTSLAVAGFRTSLDTVFVLDLDTVNQALAANGAPPVDGVVGADVLGRGHAVIDYAGGRLYLQGAAAS